VEEEPKGLAALQTPRAYWMLAVVTAAFTAAFVGVLALVGSLVARGGFTFRPFGAALVTKDGSQASRFRVFLRAFVAWSPILLVCLLIVKGPNLSKASVSQTLLQTAVLAVFLAGAIWALLHPARSIQDRIAGTWIVPR